MGARLTLAHDQRRNCTVVIVVVVVMVGSSRIETKAAMVAVKVRTNIYICVCVHLGVFWLEDMWYTWMYSNQEIRVWVVYA